MEKYNKIYSPFNVSEDEDIKPSQILSLVWKNFLPNSKILDLGCGQGTDSLFLAKNNFIVTAIDSSDVAIKQIQVKKDEFKLGNLELICGDSSCNNGETCYSCPGDCGACCSDNSDCAAGQYCSGVSAYCTGLESHGCLDGYGKEDCISIGCEWYVDVMGACTW